MAIVVPIVTQYNGRGLKQATAEINRAEGSFGKLSAAGRIAAGSLAAVGGALALGAGAFAFQSLKAYSDLNETLNKSKVIFGDAAVAIEEFGSKANTALGQTKQQAIDAAANFGIFGQAAGLSGQDLATFSTSLVSLSADLASFSNTSPEEAITALGAALRGESEPIRKYGILLDDATLKAKAMELGIYSGTGSLTQQQRVMAAYQVILSQTSNQQGDFAKTSDGLANQLRILEATAKDLQVSFGSGLAEGLGESLSATGDLQTAMEDLKVIAEELGSGIGNGIGDLVYVVQMFMDLKDAVSGVTVSMGDFGIVGDAFVKTVKQFTNPVGFATDAIRSLRGETEAAGTAATNMAYDYANAASVAARAVSMNLTDVRDSGHRPQTTDPNAKAISDLKKRAEAAEKLAASLRKTSGGASAAAAGLTAAEKAAEKAGEKFDAMRPKIERTVTRLENLGQALADARQRLTDYAQEKSDWITGGVDLSSAIKQQLDYTAQVTELDAKIAAAIAAGDAEGQAKLAAEKAGMGAAVSWSDAFVAQIGQAKGAAQAIDALLKTLNPADTLGNQRLLDSLTTLTPEQAQLAANDLVTKGLGPQIAAELSSLDVWANGTALTWAQTFHQPGVDAAQASYDAIKKTLEARLPDLYALGRKAGKSFMNGYDSVVANLPTDVRVPKAPQLLGSSTSQAPIVVNVTAGIGNPVAIAQEVQRVLASSSARLGV